MATNIESNGVDTDNIFSLYIAGQDQAAATGILASGSDLNTRYAMLKYGTSAAATGILSNGNDLSNIFAKLGTVNNPLTLYISNTASTTLTQANQLVQTAPSSGVEVDTACPSNQMGYGEMLSQGNLPTTNWPQLGSAPAPSGKGFLFDSTFLEGKTFAAGNWIPSVGFKCLSSAGGIGGYIYVRVYKRSSGGSYTNIITASSGSLTHIALYNTTSYYVGSSWSGISSSQVSFGTGDKLYMDVILDITGNNMDGTTTDMIIMYENEGNKEQLATPGYLT